MELVLVSSKDLIATTNATGGETFGRMNKEDREAGKKTLDWDRWLGVEDLGGEQGAGRAHERMAWTKLRSGM